MRTSESHPAIIVGAGPAGLATSHQLRQRGVGHVVLEKGGQPGAAWLHLYDSLRLHTGKHSSALPGMPFPRETPLFPSKDDFVSYLQWYSQSKKLPVHVGCEVFLATRENGVWSIKSSMGELSARVLIVATGLISNPHEPRFTGRADFHGRVIHSVAYRNPGEFLGDRVLIIGCGNSASEIASELADAGCQVAVSARSGSGVLPRTLAGIPIHYWGLILRPLPEPVRDGISLISAQIVGRLKGAPVLPPPRKDPCPDVPLIGTEMVDAIRAGKISLKPEVSSFHSSGVRFVDGTADLYDTVILATGYRPAIGFLGENVSLDRCGFASRVARIQSSDLPELLFVGHNYDAGGGLVNIRKDAKLAARYVSNIQI